MVQELSFVSFQIECPRLESKVEVGEMKDEDDVIERRRGRRKRVAQSINHEVVLLGAHGIEDTAPTRRVRRRGHGIYVWMYVVDDKIGEVVRSLRDWSGPSEHSNSPVEHYRMGIQPVQLRTRREAQKERTCIIQVDDERPEDSLPVRHIEGTADHANVFHRGTHYSEMTERHIRAGPRPVRYILTENSDLSDLNGR